MLKCVNMGWTVNKNEKCHRRTLCMLSCSLLVETHSCSTALMFSFNVCSMDVGGISFYFFYIFVPNSKECIKYDLFLKFKYAN